MEIEEGRIAEALEWCDRMLKANGLGEFQRLMVKLIYASKCTHGARAFNSRLLDCIGTLGASEEALPVAAVANITWFNGITMIKPLTANHVVCVDAYPRGGRGVWWGYEAYGFQIPKYVQGLQLSIGSIECWNLLVVVQACVERWSDKTVLVFTDNWSTTCALNSGRADDPLIRGTLREVWYRVAIKHINLMVRHLPGEQMGVADALS